MITFIFVFLFPILLIVVPNVIYIHHIKSKDKHLYRPFLIKNCNYCNNDKSFRDVLKYSANGEKLQ